MQPLRLEEVVDNLEDANMALNARECGLTLVLEDGVVEPHEVPVVLATLRTIKSVRHTITIQTFEIEEDGQTILEFAQKMRLGKQKAPDRHLRKRRADLEKSRFYYYQRCSSNGHEKAPVSAANTTEALDKLTAQESSY